MQHTDRKLSYVKEVSTKPRCLLKCADDRSRAADSCSNVHLSMYDMMCRINMTCANFCNLFKKREKKTFCLSCERTKCKFIVVINETFLNL